MFDGDVNDPARWWGLLLLAFALVVSGGCAVGLMARHKRDDQSEANSETVYQVVSDDGTVFTGPYADRFANIYETADTEMAKEIVKDGKITSEEYLEVAQKFSSCVSENGGTATLTPSGYLLEIVYDDDDPRWMDDENSPASKCGDKTDYDRLSMLLQNMKDNPDNVDEVSLTVTCLADNGLIDENMTVEEYGQILDSEESYHEAFDKYRLRTDPAFDSVKAQKFKECEESDAKTLQSLYGS